MKLFKHQFIAMGGPCEIHIWAKQEPLQAFAECEAKVFALQHKYSWFESDSVLNQMNGQAGSWVTIDDETYGLLQFAQTCYEQSDGLFDVTAAVFKRLWNFKQPVLPKQAALDHCLTSVGFAELKLEPHRVLMPKHYSLDLGGLVKEYAVDVVASHLKGAGFTSALVNFAGDISVTGPQSDSEKSPWMIGIPHPRDREKVYARIPLVAGAIATSGDYERFFEIDDKRYCHLINPKTGWPINPGLISASVTASTCLVAGCAASIALLKEQHGAQWLESLGLNYLATDQNLEVFGQTFE